MPFMVLFFNYHAFHVCTTMVNVHAAALQTHDAQTLSPVKQQTLL